MGNISQAITINASVVAASTLLTQYGTPAIVGESTYSTKDTPKKYTSLTTVGTDHGTTSKVYIAAKAAFEQGVRAIYAVAINASIAGTPTATEVETALATLGAFATNHLITGVCLAGIGSDKDTLTAKLKTFAEANGLIFTVTNANGATVAEIAADATALSSANGFFLAHADSDQTGDVAAAALGTLSVLKPWVTPYWKKITSDVNVYFTPADGATLEAAKVNYILDLGDGVNRMSQALTTLTTGTPKFIDITRSKYYIALTLQNAIAQYRIATEKIPYTATGLKYISGELSGALETLITAGAISEYTVIMPEITGIDAADIEDRKLTGVKVSGTLAGDMHEFEIDLTLEAI